MFKRKNLFEALDINPYCTDSYLHSLNVNCLKLAEKSFDNSDYKQGIQYLRDSLKNFSYSIFCMDEVKRIRDQYIPNVHFIL